MLSAPRARSSRRFPALAVLARVIRCLVVLLVLQLSGTAAAALEAGLGADSIECCTDCPLEKSGQECPPACPSCHCAHAQVASLPAAAPVLEVLRAVSDCAVAAPQEASAPHAPFLPSLYRPPRAIRA